VKCRSFVDGLVCVCVYGAQTMMSNDLDLLVSVEEVKMHLSSQLAARKDMTEQLKRKRRLVRDEYSRAVIDKSCCIVVCLWVAVCQGFSVCLYLSEVF